MPSSGGRVRMPHNNRVSTSAALKTNDIWSKTIGHNPYAADHEREDAESAAANAERARGLLELARHQNLASNPSSSNPNDDFVRKMFLGLKGGKKRRIAEDDRGLAKGVNGGKYGLLAKESDILSSSSEEEFIEEVVKDDDDDDNNEESNDEGRNEKERMERKERKKEKKRKTRKEKKRSKRSRRHGKKTKKRYSSDSDSSDEEESDDSSSRHRRKRSRNKRRRHKSKRTDHRKRSRKEEKYSSNDDDDNSSLSDTHEKQKAK